MASIQSLLSFMIIMALPFPSLCGLSWHRFTFDTPFGHFVGTEAPAPNSNTPFYMIGLGPEVYPPPADHVAPSEAPGPSQFDGTSPYHQRANVPKNFVPALQVRFPRQFGIQNAASDIAADFHPGGSSWKPLCQENVNSWKQRSEAYRQLEPKDQKALRVWLRQWFAQRPNEIGSYLWSLAESKRELAGKTRIWWNKSLTESNFEGSEYIPLISIGDTLHFSDNNSGLQFKNQHAAKIIERITTILSLDSSRQPRSKALNIDALLPYVANNGLSMFTTRMGQLMSVMLSDIKNQPDKKKETLSQLYLFSGFQPSMVEQLAEKALEKDENLNSLAKLPGEDIYQEIKAKLAKLSSDKERRFSKILSLG